MIEKNDRRDWAIPPWELPGYFRLDVDPHRSALLRRLANTSLVCDWAAFVLFFTIPLFIATDNSRLGVLLPPGFAVLGGTVGLAAWRLARHDLARMRGGVLDPAGEGEARFAQDRGRNCFLLSVAFMSVWAVVLLERWGPTGP